MMKSPVYSVLAAEKHLLVYPSLVGDATVLHLGAVDGRHYFAVTGGAAMPGNQPSNLDFRDEGVLQDGPLREALKKTSADYRVILAKIQRDIRAAYSESDELQAIREGDQAYQEFVQGVIQQYAAEKALLGF